MDKKTESYLFTALEALFSKEKRGKKGEEKDF